MYAQIVRFRLKPDTDAARFLHLTTDMVTWLGQQDGFLAYELYQGCDFWCDRILWSAKETAHAGLERFLATALGKEIAACVDMDHCDVFFGAAITTS